MKSKLFIITGERGAGKTLFCRRVIAAGRLAGWQVSGILSPAVFEAGEKTGIEAEDLRSSVARPLARLAKPGQEEAGSLTPRWIFNPHTLDWANERLAVATPTGLLVVDELGPLEFEGGQGWQAGMKALDGGRYRLGLVIIRGELLDKAQARWPQAKVLKVLPDQAPAIKDVFP